MPRIGRWLRAWLWGKRVTAALHAADQWESSSRELLQRLRKEKNSLEFYAKQVQDSLEVVQDLIQETRDRERQHKVALDALRDENKVMSQTTIPALVTSHKLILERLDADISVQERKKVAMAPQGE